MPKIKLPEIKVKKEFVENIFKSAIDDKEVLPVVMKLHNKINVSEFDIAKRLKMNINDVRNILYKLNEKNLVFSTRKKDKQKGWYIYFWTLNLNNVKAAFENQKGNKIEELNMVFEREKNTDYFECPEGCLRMSSMDALHYEYKCHECGTLMEQEDGSARLGSIQRQIKNLHAELEEVRNVEVPIVDLRKIEKEMRQKSGKRASKLIKKKEPLKKKPIKKASKKLINKKKKKLLKKKPLRAKLKRILFEKKAKRKLINKKPVKKLKKKSSK